MLVVRAIAVLLLLLLSHGADAQETKNYDVVGHYVNGLATIHDLQRRAQKEASESKDVTRTLMAGIGASARFQIELRAQIGTLKALKPAGDAAELVDYLIKFYDQKVDLFGQLIEIPTAMLSGPAPGMDYGRLAAEVPQISARIEAADKSIAMMANLFFALLIDMKSDRNGHVSHLTVTKAQSQQLLRTIETRFGASLDTKSPNWTVAGAQIMRANLRKDFKGSDEPW